jgi:hypothetical protein
MNYRTCFSLALIALATTAACAIKEDSAPPNIAFEVEFPSAQAAALTENVKVFAFRDASCTNLIKRLQTKQALPARAAETALLTPCQLLNGGGNTFDLPLNEDYALLAVGQVKGDDVFVGCTAQKAFGTTKALPISLTFVSAEKSIGKTSCTKLSDLCAAPPRCANQ